MHAIVVRHYWNGAHYPVGGPSEIAHQMACAIERHDGRVLVQAPVTDILCDDSGKAIGECVTFVGLLDLAVAVPATPSSIDPRILGGGGGGRLCIVYQSLYVPVSMCQG